MKNILIIVALLVSGCVSGDKFVPGEKKAVLDIQIEGLKENAGVLMVAMYHTDQNFTKNVYPVTAVSRRVSGSVMKITLHGKFIPGVYGIAVFHDENGNKTMDLSPAGMPLEGFGFSNNPSLAKGKPGWKDVSFEINENKQINIRALYP